MKAARLHQYGKPLQVDEINIPKAKGESVLVRVGGAGVCHSDLHFMKGEWQKILDVKLPLTVGHETAGHVEEMGELVQGFSKGDPVAIFGGWGCGICQNCKDGQEQLCNSPRWPGLSRYDGGYAEYILVPSYRFLVKAQGLNPKDIAPLTDAGLTPYRAVKKVRNLLNPDSFVLITGIGGLGSYAIQYFKLLSPASVITIVRNKKKANLAKEMGADHIINTSEDDVTRQINEITNSNGVDVALDIVCAKDTLSTSVNSLKKRGTLILVGLMGRTLEMPIMQSVMNEYNVSGSLWGNYNELNEVISLARLGKIKSSNEFFSLKDVGKAMEKLESGNIAGRAVLIP